MFIAALYDSQKVETNLNIQLMDKTWNSHTMDYYSTTKRNEALTHAQTQKNLENMLNERILDKRPDMIPLI